MFEDYTHSLNFRSCILKNKYSMRIFEDIIDNANIQTDDERSSNIVSKEWDYQSDLPYPDDPRFHLLISTSLEDDSITSKEDVQNVRERLYDMLDSLRVIKEFSRITIDMHDPVDEPDVI